VNRGLLITIVIGAVAGWLAALIVKGSSFGLLADIIIGLVGALVGYYLLRGYIHISPPIVAEIIRASIGAVVLLAVLRLVRQ
jgi:uncharacterized membrane protein YeaQ/YmgE (transglycosylase-associated protein family)